ncbi:MAG: hypothetical protein WCI27_07765 [Candidatus Omnitrophota bacterium]
MDNKFSRIVIAEIGIFFSFIIAAAGWFIFFQGIAPFLYEMLSRLGTEDYSYLWDDRIPQLKSLALPGVVVTAGFYPVFIVLRFIRRLVFQSSACSNDTKNYGVRTLFFLGAVFVFSLAVLWFSRQAYEGFKQRYLTEIVMAKSGYKALSDKQKARAVAQYAVMQAHEPVEGMFRDYGWYVRIVYYVQWSAFWLVILMWPAYFLWSFSGWVKRKIGT